MENQATKDPAKIQAIPIPIAAALISASATLAATGANLLFEHLNQPETRRSEFPSGVVIENLQISRKLRLAKVFRARGDHALRTAANFKAEINGLPTEQAVQNLLEITFPKIAKLNQDTMANSEFIAETLLREFNLDNNQEYGINRGQSVVVYTIDDSFGIAFMNGNDHNKFLSAVYIDSIDAVLNLIERSDNYGNLFWDLINDPDGHARSLAISEGEQKTLEHVGAGLEVTFTAAQVTSFSVRQDFEGLL